MTSYSKYIEMLDGMNVKYIENMNKYFNTFTINSNSKPFFKSNPKTKYKFYNHKKSRSELSLGIDKYLHSLTPDHRIKRAIFESSLSKFMSEYVCNNEIKYEYSHVGIIFDEICKALKEFVKKTLRPLLLTSYVESEHKKYELDIIWFIFMMISEISAPIYDLYKFVYGTHMVKSIHILNHDKLVNTLYDLMNEYFLDALKNYNIKDAKLKNAQWIIYDMLNSYKTHIDEFKKITAAISKQRFNITYRAEYKCFKYDDKHTYSTCNNNEKKEYSIKKIQHRDNNKKMSEYYMDYDRNEDNTVNHEIFWTDKRTKGLLQKISSLCYQADVVLHINAASNQYGGKHPPHIEHSNGFDFDMDLKYVDHDNVLKKICNLGGSKRAKNCKDRQIGYESLVLYIGIQALHIHNATKIIYKDSNSDHALRLSSSIFKHKPNFVLDNKHYSHIHVKFSPLDEIKPVDTNNIVGIDPEILYSIRERALKRDKNKKFKNDFFKNYDGCEKLWTRWCMRSSSNPSLLPIWSAND